MPTVGPLTLNLTDEDVEAAKLMGATLAQTIERSITASSMNSAFRVKVGCQGHPGAGDDHLQAAIRLVSGSAGRRNHLVVTR